MQITVRVGRSGQIIIPRVTREALGIVPGDVLVIDLVKKVKKLEVCDEF